MPVTAAMGPSHAPSDPASAGHLLAEADERTRNCSDQRLCPNSAARKRAKFRQRSGLPSSDIASTRLRSTSHVSPVSVEPTDTRAGVRREVGALGGWAAALDVQTGEVLEARLTPAHEEILRPVAAAGPQPDSLRGGPERAQGPGHCRWSGVTDLGGVMN